MAEGVYPADEVPSSVFNQDKIKLGIDLPTIPSFMGSVTSAKSKTTTWACSASSAALTCV